MARRKLFTAGMLVVFCCMWRYASARLETSDNSGKRYRKYDKRIVKAYNANPKRTRDVYVNAMRIVDIAQLDNSSESEAWKDKARQLITVACYYEANKALDYNDAEGVYVWSLRGIQNGDSKGQLSGINLKEISKLLVRMKNAAWKDINNQKLKYGKLMRRVTDYQKVRTENQVKINSGSPGRVQDVPLSGAAYEVTNGPVKDASGRLYVAVKLKNGRTLKIAFHQGYGWRCQPIPEFKTQLWYNTWEGCVHAVLKTMPSQK